MTSAWFGLKTGFLLGPADNSLVFSLGSRFPRRIISDLHLLNVRSSGGSRFLMLRVSWIFLEWKILVIVARVDVFVFSWTVQRVCVTAGEPKGFAHLEKRWSPNFGVDPYEHPILHNLGNL